MTYIAVNLHLSAPVPGGRGNNCKYVILLFILFIVIQPMNIFKILFGKFIFNQFS